MRQFIKTITVEMADGSKMAIDKFVVKFKDPTLTGSVWTPPPIPVMFYYTKEGGEVEVYEDGTVKMPNGATGQIIKD